VEKYSCTFGVDIWEIHLETNRENIIHVSLFDFCGQNRAGPIRVEQYRNKSADGAIIMYDLSCRATKKEVNTVLEDCLTACESIPIVIVGNKVDMIDEGTTTKVMKEWEKKARKGKARPFFAMSVKNDVGLLEPLEYLVRQLTGDDHLKLIRSFEAPAIDIVTTDMWS
jgi:GTP-binding nuclear protein Ran